MQGLVAVLMTLTKRDVADAVMSLLCCGRATCPAVSGMTPPLSASSIRPSSVYEYDGDGPIEEVKDGTTEEVEDGTPGTDEVVALETSDGREEDGHRQYPELQRR